MSGGAECVWLALIATASGGAGTLENGTAQIWNAESGKPVGDRVPHADLVYSVAFSPDGERVATGSEDGTARVWERRTGAPITPPIVNGNIVVRVSFSPDGRFLITSSLDGFARIYNAFTGELVSRLRLHQERINLSIFDRKGSRILTASDDGTAKICPLPYADRSVEDLNLMAQTAAARRIGQDGTELQPLDLDLFVEAWTNLCRSFPEEFSLVDVSATTETPLAEASPETEEATAQP